MTTCCSVFGVVLLVLTNLAVIISFATPYWVQYGIFQRSQGLWAYCQSDSCTWVFEENYKQLKTDIDVNAAWWIATLGLMCAGLALCLLSLLLATIALCCDCRGCNASHAIGGLLGLTFLVLGVAAIVFAVFANKDHRVKLESTAGRYFGWSFWLDAAASGLALLTAIIYIIDGREKTA